MRIAIAFLFALLAVGPAWSAEVAGVNIEPSVSVNSRTLTLNGSGIRKKFFVKVYIGSLYATRRLSSAAEVLRDNGDKLIRMNFLHSKVGKEKIVEAFREGIGNNAADLAGSAEERKFLALFTEDFKKGDVVDLSLGADGTVSVRHNGKLMGSLTSKRLAAGILSIYFGDRPADEDLKSGMLGKGK